MAIRIICWNIRMFGRNTMRNHTNTILDVIHPQGHGAPATADVFILIEVRGAARPWGEICSGSGAEAVRTLRDSLRARNAGWRVVPPLSLAHNSLEGIAVFYRGDRLTLAGPQVYGDELGAPPNPRQPLPNDWRDPVAPNDLTNLNNTRVGKLRFLSAANARIDFPNAGERMPYYVEFTEIVAHGNARSLRVLGFHAPEPGQNDGDDAIDGTKALATIQQIDPTVAGHNNIFIAGDFNCDTDDDDADKRAARQGAFKPLTNGAMDDPAGLQFDLDIAEDALTSLKTVGAATANNYFSCAYDKILTPRASDAQGAAVIDLVTATPAGYPGVLNWAADMRTNTFRGGAKFGRVRGLSDHFPVKIDMW